VWVGGGGGDRLTLSGQRGGHYTHKHTTRCNIQTSSVFCHKMYLCVDLNVWASCCKTLHINLMTVQMYWNTQQYRHIESCKGKVMLLQARCDQEGGYSYSSTLPWLRHYKGVSGQQHAPVVLYPQERRATHFTGGWVGPRVSLNGRKILPPLGFDPGSSSP